MSAAVAIPDVPWLLVALREYGTLEAPGAANNPRVLEYLDTCSREHGGTLGEYGASRDSTPWCAAGVGWSLLQVGYESTRSAAARSYSDYGVECEFKLGAIVVLSRGPNPAKGHVAFGVSKQGSQLYLYGGNQRDQWCVRPYPESRLLTCRWPVAVPG